jgi:hypothetical protein
MRGGGGWGGVGGEGGKIKNKKTKKAMHDGIEEEKSVPHPVYVDLR